MDQKAKITPVVILVILIIISLSLAGGSFYLFHGERIKNLTLQEELEEAKTEKRALEAKLRESKKEASALEVKLQDSEMRITTLSLDLEQEKSENQGVLIEIEQLRVDLEEQKKLKSELQEEFNRAQDEIRKTQGELVKLESRKNELEAKNVELKTKIEQLGAVGQDIELGKIVIGPGSGLAVNEQKEIEAPDLEGKVLVVNKDYNFAVIDLGTEDGIGIGNMLSIYRDKEYIGDVQVEKVHDSMAAAGFISEDVENRVNEGDRVLRKVQ